MSYLVLARKWRPRSFDTLVGQDHVVRALTHALDTQRLHHAWLFTGTRGVGKTTLSRILAKSLNCETGITAQPCGQCRACTEIDAGRYVDYVELDAASNRGVDEMTQLLEQAVYAPSSARFKVYMIDEVHMLTGHAFNAMLKTLEEPPPHVKFILATTDPQKIPVTVLSRCLQFNLKHMTVDAIVAHLQSVLSEEGLSFDVPALRLLGQAAGGSMRDALSLTDQAIAYSAGNLSLEAVQGMLGTIDQRHLLRLLQALAAGRASDVIAVADELAARGLSYAGALADLAVLLSHIAIQQRVPGALPADDPFAEEVQALAATLHPDLVQLYYSVAVHSRTELSLAPDEYAGFVMACLRMLALTPQSEHPPEPPPSGGRTPDTPVATTNDAVSASQASPVTTLDPATPANATEAPGTVSVHATSDDGPDVPAWEALPEDATSDMPTGGGAEEPPFARESAEPPYPSDREQVAVDPEHAQTETSAQQSPPEVQRQQREPEPIQSTSAPDHQVGVVATNGSTVAETSTVPVNEVVDETTNELVDEQVNAPTAEPATGQLDEPAAEPAERAAEFSDAPPDDFSSAEFQDFTHEPISVSGDPAMDGEWEPVMDMAEFDAGQIAPLPRESANPAPRTPRLARMTAQEWPALAAALPLTGLAAELARQSEWVGVEGDRITLRVAIYSLAAKQGQARLRTVLTEHFGKVVQLNVEIGATGSGTAHAVEQVRRAERQKEAERAVANDPFVRSLIEEFGARVMPGSIAPLDNERVA